MQKLARQLAAKHPDSPSAHLFHGISLYALDLHESAELAAKRGLSISADHARLWLLLGSAQVSQNRHAEGRESLNKSASIDPGISFTWSELAASYLIAGEYLDAVSSLEQLRKLNRSEFDRLIRINRARRVHPPELQAMLDHFDNMPDTAPHKAAPVEGQPTTPEKLAASLVSAFLAHGEGPDIQTELADYTATVDPYFDQGKLTRAAILKDLTTYRKEWPGRSLELIRIESARMIDANTLGATFRLRYSASDGKRNRSGTLVQEIKYTRTSGRWLVSGIRTIERVKR